MRSFFNRAAIAIGVDMKRHWIPGVWFLGRRTMGQLRNVLIESGLSRLYGCGKGYKKSELVPIMARYFRKVRDMDSGEPDQQQARDWLPEAMSFPAIDPDRQTDEQEEDDLAEAA